MTTITTVARQRVESAPEHAVRALAWIEARRMLRHPAPWVGLPLMVWFAYSLSDQTWAGARYEGLVASLTPLLLGVSVASAYAFGREHTAISDDAPMGATTRSAARLLGGLSLVGLVAVVVGVAAVWLRLSGGVMLGDEPGRTLHAQYSLPELVQPVLLAGFAVAVGAAVVHLVRNGLGASIVLFVTWFLVGATYWMFNASALRWLTPVQVQPLYVEVGSPSTDPQSFPATWLLSVPGDFQDHWVRLVVSPGVAAWHDVYLVALTTLTVAVAVRGRYRKPLAIAGALVAAVAVLMQATVTP